MSKFDDVDRLLCAQDLPTRRARLDDQLDLPDKPADGVLSDSGAPISRRSDLVRYCLLNFITESAEHNLFCSVT